jgi:hypothetical protein
MMPVWLSYKVTDTCRTIKCSGTSRLTKQEWREATILLGSRITGRKFDYILRLHYHLHLCSLSPLLKKEQSGKYGINKATIPASQTFPCHSQLTLSLSLLNLLHNNLLQTLRLRRASPPPLDLPIPPDQKFLKIPLHPLHAHQPWIFLLHPLPHLLRLLAIDIRLPQDGESNSIVELAK